MRGHRGGGAQRTDVVTVNKRQVQEGQIVYGAIGGIALAFIIQLVSGDKPPEDMWRMIALYCCACLIPISIVGFLIRSLEGGYAEKFATPWYVDLILLLVIALSQIGIWSVFMYFHERMGWLFGALMITGDIYYVIQAQRLERLNKP